MREPSSWPDRKGSLMSQAEGFTRDDLLRRFPGGAIPAAARAAWAGAAAATGTLTLGGGPIRSLDYAHSFDVSTGTVGALASEALLTYDQRLKLVPLVARSWSHPNNRTYVFRLH